MSIYPNYVLFKVFIVEKKCVLQFECHSQLINWTVQFTKLMVHIRPVLVLNSKINKQKQLLTRSHSQGHFLIRINDRTITVNDLKHASTYS